MYTPSSAGGNKYTEPPTDSGVASKNMSDYFGYAMTYQGQYDNFDSDSYVNYNQDSDQITWYSDTDKKSYTSPILNEHKRAERLGTDRNHPTGSNFYGEYRSYYQRPMIKVSKLFNKIRSKLEEYGWETELDGTFFHASNPYWNDLWMIVPQYNTAGSQLGTQIAIEGGKLGYIDPKTNGNIPVGASENYNLVAGGTGDIQGQNLVNRTESITFDNIEIVNSQNYNFKVNFPFYIRSFRHDGNNDARQRRTKSLYISAALYVGTRKIKDLTYHEGGGEIITLNDDTVLNIHPKNFSDTQFGKGRNRYEHNFYYQRRGVSETHENKTNNPSTYTFTGSGELQAGTLTGENKVYIQIRFQGDTHWYRISGGANRTQGVVIRPLTSAYLEYSTSDGIGIRSDSQVNYTDIIQSEETCKDFFTSYCKIFDIRYVKDPVEKKVSLLTRNNYFGDQARIDWTQKIDYNKEHTIQPALFPYKVGILKWQDLGTKYEEQYLSKYSKEYGSARIDTSYGFSDEEKNLLDDVIFGNCIIATDVSQYYLGRTNQLYTDNKTLPHFQNSSEEQVDTNFVLVFRDGTSNVNDVMTNRPFILTDDNIPMLSYGYSWTYTNANSNTSPTTRTVYPKLRRLIKRGEAWYSLNFGSPTTGYNDEEEEFKAENGDTLQGGETIYTKFWKGYMRDRFSEENTVLTCYVYLTLTDVQHDLFNKFIFIQNTPWVLNKITGFDPLSTAPTKCELISVQEISNYVSQEYIAGDFRIQHPANGTYIYDSRGAVEGEASSSNPVVVRTDSFSRTLSFTFTLSDNLEWKLGESPTSLSFNRTSGSGSTRFEVTLPANESGTVTSHNIPVKWGNTTTILQIVQVSNWTVTASVSPENAGTARVSDGTNSGSTLTVADSTSVTFSTTGNAGYSFGYWLLNGSYLFDRSVSSLITLDTSAVAYWIDLSRYTQMFCYDAHTTVTRLNKTGDYWVFDTGSTYEFGNAQSGLSGYLFGDDTTYTPPASVVQRVISPTDTLLTVYYDTLLAHIEVDNRSDQRFQAASISVSAPDGTGIPSPSGQVDPGEATTLLYSYPSTVYGAYGFAATPSERIYAGVTPEVVHYQSGSAIGTVTVRVENLGWQTDTYTVDYEGTTLTNVLRQPSGFSFPAIDTEEDVEVSPTSGTGDTTVTFVIPPNTATEERTIDVVAAIYNGTTFIRNESFKIVQEGNPVIPMITATPEHLTIGSQAATYDDLIQLISNGNWYILSAPEWVDCIPNSGVETPGTDIQVMVEANTTVHERSGTIRFTTEALPADTADVLITQEGMVPSLEIHISNGSETIPYTGGPATVTVTSNVPWKAEVSNSATASLSVISGNAGTSTTTLTFNTNSGASSRACRLYVYYGNSFLEAEVQQSILFTQEGDPTVYQTTNLLATDAGTVILLAYEASSTTLLTRSTQLATVRTSSGMQYMISMPYTGYLDSLTIMEGSIVTPNQVIGTVRWRQSDQ